MTFFENELKKLNNDFIKNYKFIKLKAGKLFKVYIAYLTILFSLALIYFISIDMPEDKIDELSQLNKKMIEIKKRNQFHPVSPILMKVFEDVKKNDLFISKFTLNKNQVIIRLRCKDKKEAFKMLDAYKNTNIDSITYDEKGNEYIVDASFKVFRK